MRNNIKIILHIKIIYDSTIVWSHDYNITKYRNLKIFLLLLLIAKIDNILNNKYFAITYIFIINYK